jgi:hypothetical protein
MREENHCSLENRCVEDSSVVIEYEVEIGNDALLNQIVVVQIFARLIDKVNIALANLLSRHRTRKKSPSIPDSLLSLQQEKEVELLLEKLWKKEVTEIGDRGSTVRSHRDTTSSAVQV